MTFFRLCLRSKHCSLEKCSIADELEKQSWMLITIDRNKNGCFVILENLNEILI